MTRVGQIAPYLDGIPVVPTTAIRDAQFPAPDINQRAHNLQTQYIERWDGNQWQQDVPYPAAGVLDGVAIVADQAGRTARYPSPVLNNRVQRIDSGYYERYSGSVWLQEGVTRAAGPIVSTLSTGLLVGNGIADDAPALAAADTKAVASGGRHELDLSAAPTKVLINSNLTLSAQFRPNPGAAKISVASGKTLIINGAFDPGLYRCFDPAMLGTVTFGQINRFALEWFIYGDGVNDDAPMMNKLSTMLPSQSKVVASNRTVVKLKSTWVIPARKGIDWESVLSPHPDGTGCEIQWWGKSVNFVGLDANTTSGSAIVTTTLGRFTPDMVGQYIIVDFADAFGVGGILAKILSYQSATQITMDRNANNNRSNTRYTIGMPVVFLQSCDHNSLKGFTVRPAYLTTFKGYDGYIASGTNLLNAKNPTGLFSGSHNNKMIWIQGAGPGGTDLVTTVTAVNSANQLQLAANASTTITNTTLTPFIIGPAIDCLPALYAVMTDMTHVSGVDGFSTGTECTFENLHIHSPINYGFYGIAISLAVASNQEYHHVRYCHVFCGDGIFVSSTGEFTTNGTTTVTSASNLFIPAYCGRRLRLPNQGPAGGLYDGKIIATAANGSSATLAVATTGTASGIRGIIHEGLDYAFAIGASANSKRHEFNTNDVVSAKWAQWVQGGSFNNYNNSFSQCEGNIRLEGSSEPCNCLQDNTEDALRHLDAVATRSQITFRSCRFGNIWQQPNGGYIKLGANFAAACILDHCQFDNTLTETNSTMIEVVPTSGAYLVLNELSFSNSPSPTMANVGLTGLDTQSGFVVTSTLSRTITDAPADVFTIGSIHGGQIVSILDGVSGLPAIIGKFSVASGAGTLTRAAMRGQAESPRGPGGGSFLYGLEGAYAQEDDLIGGTAWDSTTAAAIHAVLPNVTTFYARNQPHHGVLVDPPNVSSAGEIRNCYGLRIRDLKGATNSRITNGHGVWQEGTGDENQLAGRTYQATPATAPTDGNIGAAQISFYLDEAGNNLKVRVKYSNGTTLKTGTVALI